MRLQEIIGCRPVSEEEAARNRAIAAQHAPELKKLEALKAEDPDAFERDEALMARLRELRVLSSRPRRARQAVAGRVPVSESTWWQGVKCKRYPQPVKLSARTTAWRAAEIEALVKHGAAPATDEKTTTPA
jgi:predicted DNA-binding transcriptional regulator AlpA